MGGIWCMCAHGCVHKCMHMYVYICVYVCVHMGMDMRVYHGIKLFTDPGVTFAEPKTIQSFFSACPSQHPGLPSDLGGQPPTETSEKQGNKKDFGCLWRRSVPHKPGGGVALSKPLYGADMCVHVCVCILVCIHVCVCVCVRS